MASLMSGHNSEEKFDKDSYNKTADSYNKIKDKFPNAMEFRVVVLLGLFWFMTSSKTIL